MMEKKKRGRPRLENPMEERIFVRVNEETKQQLAYCKQELNLTISSVVRKGIERLYLDLKKS